MNEVASRYGQALYSLALDKGLVLKWQEEVKEIRRAFNENADFIVVLGSSFLSVEERQEMLKNTLKGIDENIVSLLQIVIANHRTNEIDNILLAFNSLCNECRGIEEGYLYSSIRLDESTIKKLETKISEVEHHQVELHNVIDPQLIGGVKVVIHDRVYDGSIKHHLEQMKKDLLKKEGK